MKMQRLRAGWASCTAKALPLRERKGKRCGWRGVRVWGGSERERGRDLYRNGETTKNIERNKTISVLQPLHRRREAPIDDAEGDRSRVRNLRSAHLQIITIPNPINGTPPITDSTLFLRFYALVHTHLSRMLLRLPRTHDALLPRFHELSLLSSQTLFFLFLGLFVTISTTTTPRRQNCSGIPSHCTGTSHTVKSNRREQRQAEERTQGALNYWLALAMADSTNLAKWKSPHHPFQSHFIHSFWALSAEKKLNVAPADWAPQKGFPHPLHWSPALTHGTYHRLPLVIKEDSIFIIH